MNLTLPYPPSANRYWRNVRGRMVISAEARAYRAAIARICRGMTPMAGAVAVDVIVFRPAKRGDLDNTLKVLLDSLKGFAFIDDDQVVDIRATRHDDKLNPRAELVVRAVAS